MSCPNLSPAFPASEVTGVFAMEPLHVAPGLSVARWDRSLGCLLLRQLSRSLRHPAASLYCLDATGSLSAPALSQLLSAESLCQVGAAERLFFSPATSAQQLLASLHALPLPPQGTSPTLVVLGADVPFLSGTLPFAEAAPLFVHVLQACRRCRAAGYRVLLTWDGHTEEGPDLAWARRLMPVADTVLVLRQQPHGGVCLEPMLAKAHSVSSPATQPPRSPRQLVEVAARARLGSAVAA